MFRSSDKGGIDKVSVVRFSPLIRKVNINISPSRGC